MSLYENQLEDTTQAFASDNETAQRIATTQRLLQRLGAAKAASSSPIPKAAAGVLDNFRMPAGLSSAFDHGPLRPTRARRSPLPQPFEPPPMPENQAYEEMAANEERQMTALTQPRRGPSDEVAEALSRSDAVLRSLRSDPEMFMADRYTDPRALQATYRAPAMTPTEGPDTGESNPNMLAANAPQGYFARLRKPESSNNPYATNPITKAAGLYQFLPSTWSDIRKKAPWLGLTADGIYDTRQQETAVQYYTDRSLNLLTKSLGRRPTMGELYALHHFGHAGGLHLVENLDKPVAATISPAAIAANPWIKPFARKPGRELLKQLEVMMGNREGDRA